MIVHRKNGTIYLRSRPGHHLHRIRFSNDEFESEMEFENAIRNVGEKKEGQCIWGYINGVWNTPKHATNSTNLISTIAEHEQVFSLINNTKGRVKDILECGRQKLSKETTIVKFAAKFFELLIQLSEEEIIDCFASEDVAYYLETTDAKAKAAFYQERTRFYQEEFRNISNLTVLKQSEDATGGYWEHSFVSPCYQKKLAEIIQQYRQVLCEVSP